MTTTKAVLACTTMVSVLIVSALLNLISVSTAIVAAATGIALVAVIRKVRDEGLAPVPVSTMLYGESLRRK